MIEKLIDEVIKAITISVPAEVRSGRNRDWTFAVWKAFDALSRDHGLEMYPPKKPYKGEYLTDFSLFHPQTGPLLACESQLWSPWGDEKQNQDGIAWAFDKLRGVKAPIKVLIFEFDFEPNGSFPSSLSDQLKKYLLNFDLHSIRERYIFIQFSENEPRVYRWEPTHDGLHEPNEICFRPMPEY